MPQPAEGPATRPAVKLQLSSTTDVDDEFIDVCVEAANDLVRTLRIAQIDAETWPHRVSRGAAMLAARLVRRRNSPDGVQAMTEQGAAYVSRSDPDIAHLLNIGTYAKPVAR